jgi:hypothetical protein
MRDGPGRYILVGHVAVEEPDLFAWGRWLQEADRIVRRSVLEGGVVISTVFLGLDHDMGGEGPKLFETMILGGPEKNARRRYATWDEAEDGHIEMLKRAISVNYHPAKT